MKWRKLGLLWAPSGERPWARAHAMLPTPVLRADGGIRLLVGCTDENTVGRVGWIDLAPDDPRRVIGEAEAPVLDIGRPGMFDDNGVVPSCVVEADGGLRLYYVGFQLQRQVPYTLFSGMATGDRTAARFGRTGETPILDRAEGEAFFRAAPFVIRDGTRWRMWYIGGGDWADADGKPQPIYSLRYAESNDGIYWPRGGQECLAPALPNEIGFGRPWVMRGGAQWRLWYSIRGLRGYRLGFATSDNGTTWSRRDSEVGITLSEDGWDSEMICYGAVCHVGDELVMFYNGNGFGRTGVGLAVLEQD